MHGTQRRMLAAGRALRDIVPYKDIFLQKAIPADFMERLQAAIDAINDEKDESAAARSRVISATAGIRSAVQRGLDAVRCLDNVVRRCCKADPMNDPSEGGCYPFSALAGLSLSKKMKLRCEVIVSRRYSR